MCFNIVTLDMFLIFNIIPNYYLNTFVKMENAENEKNDKTNHVKTHPLSTTFELCTLCTQYVFVYTFYLDKGFKKIVFFLILKIYICNQKSLTKLNVYNLFFHHIYAIVCVYFILIIFYIFHILYTSTQCLI